MLCGAPPNPYGYNFCGRGGEIHAADLPDDICDYFDCIEDFTDGPGYLVECRDSTYSMAGGFRWACFEHDGVRQQVYSG